MNVPEPFFVVLCMFALLGVLDVVLYVRKLWTDDDNEPARRLADNESSRDGGSA